MFIANMHVTNKPISQREDGKEMALTEITLKQAVEQLAAKVNKSGNGQEDTDRRRVYMLVELSPYESMYRLADAAKVFLEE